MKVVILGADRFLGSNIASVLLRRKDEITAFCPRSVRLDALRGRGIAVVEGDFLDSST